MNTFKTIAMLAVIAVAFSCNNNQQKSDAIKKEIEVSRTEIPVTGEREKVVASVGIEGMSCAVGCARMINKTLNDLEGVTIADVVFEDKMANVEYDESAISEKEVVAAIEALHDGQYKVTKVDITKYTANPSAEKEHPQKSGNGVSGLNNDKKI